MTTVIQSAQVDVAEITRNVVEQYEAIRSGGAHNMLDRAAVYESARKRRFSALCNILLRDDGEGTHFYANLQRNYAHYRARFGV